MCTDLSKTTQEECQGEYIDYINSDIDLPIVKQREWIRSVTYEPSDMVSTGCPQKIPTFQLNLVLTVYVVDTLFVIV